MEVQLDLYLKFTPDGAKKFLEKIKDQIPEFYKKKGKEYIISTIPKEWKDIDSVFYEKKITTRRKLFYDHIYLFQKHGAISTHSGEINMEDLAVVIKEFFSDERDALLQAEQQANESDDNLTTIKYGSYGTLIKKENIKQGRPTGAEKKTQRLTAQKIPDDITQSSWSLYSFWEEDEYNKLKQTTGRKRHGILQSLVKFEEEKITIYYQDKFDNIERFEGKTQSFNYHEQTYIETELMPLSDQRQVRVMFLFGKQIGELAMVVFYNIRSEGALFSGSGLLIRGQEKAQLLIENKKCILHHHTSNQTINHFFERRSQNYLKLPRITDYDLQSLQNKLNILLSKSIPKDIRLYKHDFYISIPMSYIPNGKLEFKKNKAFCNDTIAVLKEHFNLKKAYFACEKYDFNTYETMMRSTHYEDSMEGISESKLFILVIPEIKYPSKDSAIRFSSIWAELGYAIGLKKPILIICDIDFKNQLPNIVESLNKQIMVATPDMADIKKMELWFEVGSNKIEIDKFLREKFVL